MKRGKSHELAILLLTEAITFYTKTLRKDLWCLFLDKLSAFHFILKEIVVAADVSAIGGPQCVDRGSLYIANRLSWFEDGNNMSL